MTRPEIDLIHRMVAFVIRRAPISTEHKKKMLEDMQEIFIQMKVDVNEQE